MVQAFELMKQCVEQLRQPVVPFSLRELRDQFIKIIFVLVNYHLYYINSVFVGENEQTQQHKELFLYLLRADVVERAQLHHYVL